ncbi:MAG: acetate--CoA ligase [Planctomycetota bacterium]
MSSKKSALDGLFRPRSVAVIGASRRRGSIGRQIVHNLIASGFSGPVYPVNPKAEVVCSVPAFPSVGKIPGPVDLAIIVVPPDTALRVAEACGRKGVKALVVITAGFREIGGIGVAREEKLQRIARRYGMRVIGPNCMGIINTEAGVSLNASFAATTVSQGSVAMVSQSGALGEAILADATNAGLGVAMFASVGNRVDVTAADLVAYWENVPQVKIILLYLESVGEPEEFVQVARRVSRKKPIIAVKSGRSDAGAAAAGSHTGSVAGADVAADTLLAQCGVLRVESFRDMFLLAHALLAQPLPAGPRLAVVTNAGGPGILATDALVACGLQMVALQDSTAQALRKVLPVEASIHNPVDLIASADGERYRKALRLVVRDRNVDALVVLFVSPAMIDAEAVARAIIEELGGKKTVLACVMGRQRADEAQAILQQNGIPVFRYPEDAATTIRAMVKRRIWLDRKPARVRPFQVDRKAAARILDRRDAGWLSAADAEAVLSAYGIPFAPSRRVKGPGDAVAAAHDLGLPVVVKAEAPGLLHKSDYQAVRTGLRSGDEVFAAASDLLDRLRPEFPGVTLQVQSHAEGHREVLLGMTRDPRYGPLYAAGLGGVQVEVLRDVALRVGPLDARDPHEMFGQLKGKALLGRFRGAPAACVDHAVDALLRIQRLADDFPRVAEVEVNPFILATRKKRSAAVDARLRLSGR